MKTFGNLSIIFTSIFLTGCGSSFVQKSDSTSTYSSNVAANEALSEWVYPGIDGKLVYKKTPAGDRIMDFSHAGYMGGGVKIPDVPVKETLYPSGGDDTDRIQDAIEKVSNMPLEGKFRGAVLLAPGTYNISKTIMISSSGVVLRGSGSGLEGDAKSTINLVGSPFNAITLRASTNRQANPNIGVSAEYQTRIVDAYVPSGSMTFTVADASRFSAGDAIAIRKKVTAKWVEFMQMHDLVRDGKPQTWIQVSNFLSTERRIANVSGNTITLDAPLSDSFDSRFLAPDGAIVEKIVPPVRVSQSGIENLHIVSPPQPIPHTQPHFTALRINGEDCWVRNLMIEETMNSVGIGGRRITVERVTITRSALHQGSSRPAKFAPNGTQVLIDRCSVVADNVWFIATGGGQAGPIVVLNCNFIGDRNAESHQRWSTGMLYDNVHAPQGGIDFRNRGSMGSGHGWSMGWGVAWNCVAKEYIIQHPPGAPNWMIGCIGHSRPVPRPFGDGPNLPEGIKDSHGTPVTPQSLYLTQLVERLGPQALKNIGY